MPAKQRIPVSLKQNVWVKYNGEIYKAKCNVEWCENHITPFTFEAGHNIPESKGGETSLDNLRPICSSCNKSMGNRYTIQEYSEIYKKSNTGNTGNTENTADTNQSKRKRTRIERMDWCYCFSSS